MRVTLYGKENCGMCMAAKDKLVRLGVEFEVRDLEYLTAYHEGWREDGSVELQAAYALLRNKVPIISIDGEWFDYPGSMRHLKGRK